jgi:hypothetical protein
MNKAKWFGCVVLVLCLFTSCPQGSAGVFKLWVVNYSPTLNVTSVSAINFTGGDDYDVVSENLLNSVLVAGDEVRKTIPLRQVADGDGILVSMSDFSTYTERIPGGYKNGMEVDITMINSLQGVLRMDVFVE